MLALALLIASGPLAVDDARPPAGAGAVVGGVMGGVVGAGVGVGVALAVAAVADANSPCHHPGPGVHCTDDLDGAMAGLETGMIAVPIGALAGAGIGAFLMYPAVENEPPRASVEHAY